MQAVVGLGRALFDRSLVEAVQGIALFRYTRVLQHGLMSDRRRGGKGLLCLITYTHRSYLVFVGITLAGLTNCEMKSMGTGKMIVEFFSAAMELRV